MKISLKLLIFLSAVIYFICLLIPEMMLTDIKNNEKENTPSELFTPGNKIINTSSSFQSELTYEIYDEGTKEILKIPEKDFLISTVSLEISPLTHKEAIKAQAVAARSFYRYKKDNRESEDYDFTVNTLSPYIYTHEEYFKEKWGENYEDYRKIIESSIDETENEVLIYSEEIACCSFFAMSDGVTESAKDVWNLDYPYLIPVASPYDSLSPYFEAKKEFTPDEVKKLMEEYYPEAIFNFSMPYENWFTEIRYNTSSSVKSVNICGFSITGNEARNIFSLRSATFDVIFEGETFIFKTKGYGHGVGMSQTGASYMAESGSDYKEILSLYYPGTALTKLA